MELSSSACMLCSQMKVVLVNPQIPNNTGNIGRLCLGTGTELHLIKPLGYELSDKYLKRAGLDYWQYIDLKVHDSWEAFVLSEMPVHLCFLTKKAPRTYLNHSFQEDEYLVFGRESDGLPVKILEENKDNLFSIPLLDPRVRSYNLANSVSIVLFEALRQVQFL